MKQQRSKESEKRKEERREEKKKKVRRKKIKVGENVEKWPNMNIPVIQCFAPPEARKVSLLKRREWRRPVR